jgi:hypothetical protein
MRYYTLPVIGILVATMGWGVALAQPKSTKTVFACVAKEGGGMATVARRGNLETPPLITWEKTIGVDWTPEKRCQEVAQRLSKAVEDNGGKLVGLTISYGPVNNQPVICYAKSQDEACSAKTMLFTLTGDNAKNPEKVLQSIRAFALKATGTAISEEDKLITPDGSHLDLELWFDHVTTAKASSQPSPQGGI